MWFCALCCRLLWLFGFGWVDLLHVVWLFNGVGFDCAVGRFVWMAYDYDCGCVWVGGAVFWLGCGVFGVVCLIVCLVLVGFGCSLAIPWWLDMLYDVGSRGCLWCGFGPVCAEFSFVIYVVGFRFRLVYGCSV